MPASVRRHCWCILAALWPDVYGGQGRHRGAQFVLDALYQCLGLAHRQVIGEISADDCFEFRDALTYMPASMPRGVGS